MTPMTVKQIEEAKARAQAIVDGFKTPSQQCARDAARLAEQLLARERQVTALAERVSVAERSKLDPFGGIFGF